MRQLLFLILSIPMLFISCSVDFDEFDKSDYRNLDYLSFEGQTGSTSISFSEKLLKVSFPSDIKDDSLVIESLEMGSFSKLYLVKSKVLEVPQSSLGMDSLASEVDLEKTALKEGSKIRLPESREFYLVVVSESGLKTIWTVKVEVEGDLTPNSSSSSITTSSSSSSISSSSFVSSSSASSSSSLAPSSYPVPQIKAIRLGGQSAQIDHEAGRIIADNLAFLTDLTAVVVSEIEFSEGATSADIKNDGIYDMVRAKSVVLSTPDGQSKTYEVKAGYQYPNSDFNVWTNDDKDVEGGHWANGNNSVIEITSKYDNVFIGAKMETKSVIGKLASGNLFTGVFNPKKATLFQMAGYKNGNELIDFGQPFKGRPEFVELDFTYDGKGDSCDFYVLLEKRTSIKDNGLNQFRTSSDVNTLIASAWFRSISDSETSDPDVDTIITNSVGTKTLRLKLKYGEPLTNSPIFDSKVFSATLENSKGIDNHLVQGTGEEEVTHIRIAMASSAKGDLYKGSDGAVLIVDELRLIY